MPFAPTAGTQCLLRAYGGHTVPFRAYGGHTVPFRAYGGHTVPFAPTAGTQCLSPPYGVPYKRKLQGICLPLHTGKALQKQANRFTKARKEEIQRSHTTSGKQQRKTQKDPALGNLPGLGPCCLLGKSLPLYFRLANGYRAVLHGTCNVFRGRAASFAPTAATTEANRNYGVFRSARENPIGSNQPIITAQCLTAFWPGRVV